MNNSEAQKPSKSQRKREMTELKQLAQKIAGLSAAQLDRLPYPELQEAARQAQAITKGGARRRQIQFIAKLLSQLDVQPVRDALAINEAGSQAWTQQFHQLESWRASLVAGNLDVIQEIVAAYPDADRRQLRQLSRNAISERERGDSQQQFRKLFQYLKSLADG